VFAAIKREKEPMTSAEVCKERGWTVDDVLESDHGSTVRITAIGVQRVLACEVGGDGKDGMELDLELATPLRWRKVALRIWRKGENSYEFVDCAGDYCILHIQPSGALAFGRCSGPMHLTGDKMATLLPYLQRYTACGKLDPGGPEDA